MMSWCYILCHQKQCAHACFLLYVFWCYRKLYLFSCYWRPGFMTAPLNCFFVFTITIPFAFQNMTQEVFTRHLVLFCIHQVILQTHVPQISHSASVTIVDFYKANLAPALSHIPAPGLGQRWLSHVPLGLILDSYLSWEKNSATSVEPQNLAQACLMMAGINPTPTHQLQTYAKQNWIRPLWW